MFEPWEYFIQQIELNKKGREKEDSKIDYK